MGAKTKTQSIKDRWGWKGFIPTHHGSDLGFVARSYELRTQEILNRKPRFFWLIRLIRKRR